QKNVQTAARSEIDDRLAGAQIRRCRRVAAHNPMFASAGIDRSSSAEYPNASATARTPSCSDDNLLTATAPYLERTTSSILVDIFDSPSHLLEYTSKRMCRAYTSWRIYVKAYVLW